MDITELLAKRNNQQNSSKEEFTPATGWLNIGGTVEGTFVSIGGLPIESIKPLKGSSDFSKVQRSLISAILKKFEALKEGEATSINLQVEIRKVGTEVASDINIDWDL